MFLEIIKTGSTCLKELRTPLNGAVRNVRTEEFAKLTTGKNPKVPFDTIVCAAIPKIPEFSKVDSNTFLNFFVDKNRDVRANSSPSYLYDSACDLPPPHRWTTFTAQGDCSAWHGSFPLS